MGISIGNALKEPVGEIWHRLSTSWKTMPLLAALVEHGPLGLLEAAQNWLCSRC